MSGTSTSVDFLPSDLSAQLRKCRQMADEVDALLAKATTAEMRAIYHDLKKQCGVLVDEIEQVAILNAGAP